MNDETKVDNAEAQQAPEEGYYEAQVEAEQDAAPEAPAQDQPPSIEDKAKSQGWVEKDGFKGNEDDYVGPAEFVRRILSDGDFSVAGCESVPTREAVH